MFCPSFGGSEARRQSLNKRNVRFGSISSSERQPLYAVMLQIGHNFRKESKLMAAIAAKAG